jgi:hypothetical protein
MDSRAGGINFYVGTTNTAQNTINLNGGVLKTSGNDPSSSTFRPALSGMTVDVDSGCTMNNPNSYNITMAAVLWHGTGTPDGGLGLNDSGTLTLNSAGNNYNYIAKRATKLMSPVWVNLLTNTAATNGVITISDYLSDLSSKAPISAYYRLKWPPPR